MRVNGLPKPKGEMKVKGGGLPTGADPRPMRRCRRLRSTPKRVPHKGRASDECLSPAAAWSRGQSAARRGPGDSVLRLFAGGRRPGTCHTTPRVNLWLITLALLGLSVGGLPRVGPGP